MSWSCNFYFSNVSSWLRPPATTMAVSIRGPRLSTEGWRWGFFSSNELRRFMGEFFMRSRLSARHFSMSSWQWVSLTSRELNWLETSILLEFLEIAIGVRACSVAGIGRLTILLQRQLDNGAAIAKALFSRHSSGTGSNGNLRRAGRRINLRRGDICLLLAVVLYDMVTLENKDNFEKWAQVTSDVWS